MGAGPVVDAPRAPLAVAPVSDDEIVIPGGAVDAVVGLAPKSDEADVEGASVVEVEVAAVVGCVLLGGGFRLKVGIPAGVVEAVDTG